MIHICYTYRTSSQSSPLHNEPSWTFDLLHATLQQNDCTNSSLPITLWPCVDIEIIQTGIQLNSLVVSSIIPSLKQISSQVPRHMMILNVDFNFHEILTAEFSPSNRACWKSTLAKWIQHEFQQTSRLWLLLFLRPMWWLRWLDPLSSECRILGCQEQILCKLPELGFEKHSSGLYLLPCLVVEWAGLQVVFWCLVRLSTEALSWSFFLCQSSWVGYSVCSGLFWGERWWSVDVVADDGVHSCLVWSLQICCRRWLSFHYHG